MAFIKTEEVKNIRTQLKKEFPNLKFSVTRENYSKVKIVIRSGNIDFIADYKEGLEREYLSVNHFHIESNFNGVSKEALIKINSIAHSQDWYDESEAMIDYFNTAYYVTISVGSWDMPYILNNATNKKMVA